MASGGDARRVAILLPSLRYGGAERVALTLAKALRDELGMQVEFLLMRAEGEFLREASDGFEVVDLRCDRTWKLPGRLLSRMRRSRPDVLLSSFWKLNLCACVAKALRPSLRLLLWEHSLIGKSANSPVALFAPTASAAYRIAHAVICVSTGVRDDIARHSRGLRRRLVVIPNPIQPPDPGLVASVAGMAGDTIAWVGRMAPAKNPGLLLEAFAMIAARCDGSLLYIGDGGERAALERRVAELGLGERVRFAGYQADPYPLLAGCRLLAVTSDHEGFGNVLVEAMYCGLRVVSTDCGAGVREILAGGRGTIVPVGDAVALADAIRRELDAPADKAAQRESARRFLPAMVARRFAELM